MTDISLDHTYNSGDLTRIQFTGLEANPNFVSDLPHDLVLDTGVSEKWPPRLLIEGSRIGEGAGIGENNPSQPPTQASSSSNLTSPIDDNPDLDKSRSSQIDYGNSRVPSDHKTTSLSKGITPAILSVPTATKHTPIQSTDVK